MAKNALLLLVLPVLLCLPVATYSQKGDSRDQTDIAARIANLDNLIKLQLRENSDLVFKQNKLISDSADSEENTVKKKAALSLAIKALSDTIVKKKARVEAFKQASVSFNSNLSANQSGVEAAAARMHTSVAKFESNSGHLKVSLETAQKNIDRAKEDSSEIGKKASREMDGLNDSLSSLDQQLTSLRRQVEGLTSSQKQIRQDSASAWKKNDDSLRAVIKVLHEARQSAVKNDSTLKSLTNQLVSLKKDSAVLVARYQQGIKNQDIDTRYHDSLALVLQNRKSTILHCDEKLRMDSLILALGDRARELQKEGASSEKTEEIQQKIESYKTNRDKLLGDQALVAMLATFGKSSREVIQSQLARDLSAIERSLDSLAQVRKNIFRDKVYLEKEFKDKSREFAVLNDTLNSRIKKATPESINQKGRLPKIETDSAGVFQRRTAMAESYRKKQGPIADSISKINTQIAALSRQRTALDSRTKERAAFHTRNLGQAHAGIVQSQALKQRAQSAYDALLKQQAKAREDSAAAVNVINAKVAEARLQAGVKQEQITVETGQIKLLETQLAQVKTDSANSIYENKQKQIGFQQGLADLRFKILNGEQALEDLHAEKKKLRQQAAGNQNK